MSVLLCVDSGGLSVTPKSACVGNGKWFSFGCPQRNIESSICYDIIAFFPAIDSQTLRQVLYTFRDKLQLERVD